jgi:GNAT superfamily N-acetyltransferase
MEEIEESHLENDAQFIRRKLNEYNLAHLQPDNHEELCLIERSGDKVIGGLLGGTYWDWLYVKYLWVDENERHRGLGTGLLGKAEEIALDRGCRNAHLETHDFQDLEFYEGHGYLVFGVLADLPEGHTKYYLHKSLATRLPKQPNASSN